MRSLSSGLDIVRKVLGRHEIATIQTTAVDQAAGIINLTTVLAHASGEWIASDWPVCTIAETATPHRMGAALTYARRYALFTLVGIAGEDDLDAPDLVTPTDMSPDKASAHAKAGTNGKLNGGHETLVDRARPRRNAKGQPPKEMLGPEASGELRDRLLFELSGFALGDDVVLWTHRSLPEKNKLTAADALRVEQAFEARLASLSTDKSSDKPEVPLAPSPNEKPKKRERRGGRRQGRSYPCGTTSGS